MRLLGRRIVRRRDALMGVVVAIALAVLVAQIGVWPFGTARAHADRVAGWTSAGRLRYATTDGRPLWLDEYLPRVHRGRLPAVLVVHGGGWAHGSPAGFSQVAQRLAAAGFAVFDAEYTLATPGRPGLTMQPAQVQAATQWITRHARALDLDPGGIGALGSSAGGNLVARVALLPDERDLKAVVTWSGPMNLDAFAPLVNRTCRDGECGTHWLATDLVEYVGCRPAVCPTRWNLGSPLDDVRRDAPPMLLFNSAHELVPLAGTLSFESRLRHDGDSVRLVVYSGTRHAGAYGATALGPTVDFLRSELVSVARPVSRASGSQPGLAAGDRPALRRALLASAP
jgi:acetyl esterase